MSEIHPRAVADQARASIEVCNVGSGSLADPCGAARPVSAYERKADAFYCDFLAGQCPQPAEGV